MLKSEKTEAGGYDCFFLDDPPSDLICPICRLVARNPHQASCCGKIYCHECFCQLQQRSKWLFRCANCREEEPSVFPDRKTAGQINSLRTACPNREGGCDWRGAVRDLDMHLRRCDFADIECPFRHLGCFLRPLRKDLAEHEEANIQIHLGLATKKIKELEESIEEETQIQEKKITTAITDVKSIVQLQKKETKKQIDRRFETHGEELENKLHELRTRITSEQRNPPVLFRLSDFSDYQDDDEDWHSPAFYTHPGGYRMCLRIYTNGSSDVRGTHLSCYIYLMRGDYDEQLEWPFRGTVCIELLNQLEDANHHEETVTFNTSDPKNYNVRVKKGNMGVTGLGKSKFIIQSELNLKVAIKRQYLKDDCLFFRVSHVDVQSVSKPWLANYIEEDSTD